MASSTPAGPELTDCGWHFVNGLSGPFAALCLARVECPEDWQGTEGAPVGFEMEPPLHDSLLLSNAVHVFRLAFVWKTDAAEPAATTRRRPSHLIRLRPP